MGPHKLLKKHQIVKWPVIWNYMAFMWRQCRVVQTSFHAFIRKNAMYPSWVDIFLIEIESTTATSMEDVSTGVLENNKEYLRSKDKAKKWYDVSRHIQLHISQYKKWRYTIQLVKPTAQLVFKNRFPKGGPTCRRQVGNPRHQTSQGQSVAKPNIFQENSWWITIEVITYPCPNLSSTILVKRSF